MPVQGTFLGVLVLDPLLLLGRPWLGGTSTEACFRRFPEWNKSENPSN